MTEEPTCQGSVGPDARELLEDKPKRCEACCKLMTREELKAHRHLCEHCSLTIDRDTKARKEEEELGWFE